MRVLAALAILIGLALAAPASAQRIEGPAAIADRTLARLVVVDLPSEVQAAILWDAPSLDSLSLDDGYALDVTGSPGLHRIIARVVLVDFDARTFRFVEYRHSLTIAGVAPDPDPDPDPDPPPGPDPPPAPILGRLHVSYIVDAVQVTPDEAAIRTDRQLRSELAALDAAWHTYQSNEEDLDRLNFRRTTDPLGYPVAIVQDSTGRVIDSLRLPTADRIVRSVRRLRGID